ncbi:hypothetical protein OSB04_002486 [Centaurea solstitialis]|uniref:Uncharacterized protein n=1 Tax=Centaurea solstitialis TaxID=347529 RepID=A0AA38TT33_9ASTR|nr:hypothetical protein OSB04_002486 [Centaurea solstitialis]
MAGYPLPPWNYGWPPQSSWSPSASPSRPSRGSQARQQPGLLGSAPQHQQQSPYAVPPAVFHATTTPH